MDSMGNKAKIKDYEAIRLDEVKAAGAGFFDSKNVSRDVVLAAGLLKIILKMLKDARMKHNADLEIDIIRCLDKLNFYVEWRGDEPTICDKEVHKALDILFREGNGH